MADFTVEVPISFEGGKGEDGTSGTAKLKASVDNLSKSIVEGVSIFKILGEFLGDIINLLNPLIKLLSLILLLFFLPLLPILKILIKGLAFFAEFLRKLGKGEEGVIGKIFAVIMAAVGAIILTSLTSWIAALLLAVGGIIFFFWEDIGNLLKSSFENIILPVFQFIGEGLTLVWNFLFASFSKIWTGLNLVWDTLKASWQVLINAGSWIWENILKPGFSFLSNVGRMIWDIIKIPFVALANKISNLFGGRGSGRTVQDAIIRPNGEIIQTSPSDTLIATKNPEGLLGSSNKININFNNPVVRNDNDLKKIADEVSKVLRRKLTGRISAG